MACATGFQRDAALQQLGGVDLHLQSGQCHQRHAGRATHPHPLQLDRGTQLVFQQTHADTRDLQPRTFDLLVDLGLDLARPQSGP